LEDLFMQHMGILWMVDLSDLIAAVPAVGAPRAPVVFEAAGLEQVGELAEAMGYGSSTGEKERTAEVVRQRFATGRSCYVGRVEGRLATYGWVTFDEEKIGELGLSIRMEPGEAYIWNCGTLADFRGRRLYPALVTYIVEALQKDGLRRVWIGTDADNFPSQSGLALTSFQPVADVMVTEPPSAHQLWMRGRPGVSEQVVAAARRAMFGDQEFWSSASA